MLSKQISSPKVGLIVQGRNGIREVVRVFDGISTNRVPTHFIDYKQNGVVKCISRESWQDWCRKNNVNIVSQKISVNPTTIKEFTDPAQIKTAPIGMGTGAKKTHIAFCLDESGSVATIKRALIAAYNINVVGIRNAVMNEGQEATMSAYAFGDRYLKHRTIYEGVQVQTVRSLNDNDLKPSGMTPLFDSVHRAIRALEKLDDGNPDTVFIITAVTDGDENDSRSPGVAETQRLIQEKVGSDRWTFTWLVPNKYVNSFCSKYKINRGNILPWDETSDMGTEQAFQTNTEAYSSFFSARSAGAKSTNTFYSNVANVSKEEVKQKLVDITSEVCILPINSTVEIAPYIESVTRKAFVKGSAFYMLMKAEKEVQDYKKIVIRDRTTKHVYTGGGARQLLGLPAFGTVRLVPGDHGDFDIFIQSTSLNRKLLPGTFVLHWPTVR